MCDEFSGAGVIIIEVPRARRNQQRELQVVVFRDKTKKAYADAGGKCEHVKHNNDPLKTAQEELFEESGSLLRVNARYLSGYVEKTVGKRQRWYRGYFLFTEELDRKDYQHNIEVLKDMCAEHYLQETDDMVRFPLSLVYRTVMIDYPEKATVSVVLKSGRKIKLHKRLVELMRIAFENNPEWILKVMSESPFGRYSRRQGKNGLIHYVYKT